MSDEREEGEIVDDDFEDISDNSIILPSVSLGKSVSPKDKLRDLSLSSLSGFEEEDRRERRKYARRNSSSKHGRKRRKLHRRPSKVLEYSDSDDEMDKKIDKKLQRKLKAAIHVDGEEETHKNSLQARLKGMTNMPVKAPEVNNSILTETEPTQINGKNSEQEVTIVSNEDDRIDRELLELRLEALRTTFLNKHKDKKSKKIENITDETDTNKENTCVNQEENNQIHTTEKKEVTTMPAIENNKNVGNDNTIEEDEDILRAHVLASLSKKLIEKNPEKLPSSAISSKSVIIKKSSYLNNILHKKIVTRKVNTNNFNKVINVVNKNKIVRNTNIKAVSQTAPQVKPFIISLSGDSDTEDETGNNIVDVATKDSKSTDQNALLSGIESTVDKFLKEQRAKAEAQVKKVVEVKKSVMPSTTKPSVLEKSAMKLLPKSKQIEYHKLLLKLKNAEKRPRMRKHSVSKVADTKVSLNVSKNKLLNKSKSITNKMLQSKLDKSQERRTETMLLKSTIEDMQEVVNERLQIQDRYKVVRPLIKQINEASKERKKCEQEVKRLLEELAEAKKRQLSSQQAFSLTVKKLLAKKEEIDKRTTVPIVTSQTNHFTSTPFKDKNPVSSLELSSISANTVLEAPVDAQKLIFDSSVNIGDPNDIDWIINNAKPVFEAPRITEKMSDFLTYDSPLEMFKSSHTSDPFSILCPFEVNGTCKDTDCTYKHFLKR